MKANSAESRRRKHSSGNGGSVTREADWSNLNHNRKDKNKKNKKERERANRKAKERKEKKKREKRVRESEGSNQRDGPYEADRS